MPRALRDELSDLERLVLDAEGSPQLQGVLRRCRSRNDLLQTARRLGYRVTQNDLRHAWLQHLQDAKAQEPSALKPATGARR
jgi:argininosuccinate lyase